MADTDWDSQTVIRKRADKSHVTRSQSDINAARRAGAVVATERKHSGTQNKAHVGTDHQRIAKIDRENEVAPPPKVDISVGRAIQRARQDSSLTQKELAQRINEKPQVVNEYESGKAVPNQQILSKLERVLGVKLRGKDIGTPFGSK